MKFLDLFAGIGGFRLGMEAAGHTCVGFCESDRFARASYKAIYDTEGEAELHDITTVSDETFRGLGPIDIICAGFPCQAFSLAGNRRGFEDTRGTLFFDVARAASILKPKYLVLENVRGLLSHDRGLTFETILRTLGQLGYNVEWQVLNSKYVVPQDRSRVFIVGHLRSGGGVPDRYFLSAEMTKRLLSYKDNQCLPIHSQQDTQLLNPEDRMLLKVNSRKSIKSGISTLLEEE